MVPMFGELLKVSRKTLSERFLLVFIVILFFLSLTDTVCVSGVSGNNVKITEKLLSDILYIYIFFFVAICVSKVWVEILE